MQASPFHVTDPANSGAYRLIVQLPIPIEIEVGRLGCVTFAAGEYVYVGNARRCLKQRVARHQRLAEQKQGRRHWHVDALLLHPASRLDQVEIFPGGNECALSRLLARRRDVVVAVPGFGATDCRQRCPAHLYRLPPKSRRRDHAR